MDLKDIVELSLSTTFTEGTICFIQSKITDHRQVLSEVFPQFTLKPKHHYIEHYPDQTFWTTCQPVDNAY